MFCLSHPPIVGSSSYLKKSAMELHSGLFAAKYSTCACDETFRKPCQQLVRYKTHGHCDLLNVIKHQRSSFSELCRWLMALTWYCFVLFPGVEQLCKNGIMTGTYVDALRVCGGSNKSPSSKRKFECLGVRQRAREKF